MENLVFRVYTECYYVNVILGSMRVKLLSIVYGCETWSFTLNEGNSLRWFGAERWGKCFNARRRK